MPSSKPEIRELDRVVLTDSLPEYGLKAGDIGTVVDVYRGGEGFEVEVCDLTGDTIAVATVSAGQVRPIAHGEVPHARRLAG
jgi:hypothetical protein